MYDSFFSSFLFENEVNVKQKFHLLYLLKTVEWYCSRCNQYELYVI